MKAFLILTIAVLTTTSAFSQVVFQVTSNPCNPTLEQTYTFEYAGWLDGSSTDWNIPDITNPSNAIQGELVFVNDGTTQGIFNNIGTPSISIETTTDACEDSLWTQDLTGKIAVIWRGTCEYSCKAERAQNRGAIGVIIINHTGYAMGMGGGTCGLNVNIPVLMIGRKDGELLMNCISSGGMMAFIGEVNGHFNNNLGSSMGEILMTESSAIPWMLAQNGIEYPVDFGLWIRNNGINPQNGVTASVNVTFNGLIVYTQTSTLLNFNVLDTQYINLGTFAPSQWNVGTYVATYTVNNPTDQFFSDNTFSFEFKFTQNDDVYAKCRLDSFNNPIHDYSTSYDDGYDCFYEICIAFKNAYAGTRNTMVKGMTLSSAPVGYGIENEPIMIKVYQWNDVFTDINTPLTFNSLLLLDSAYYTYPDNTLIDSNIFVSYNYPIALEDNKRYLFCLDKPDNDSLRLGADSKINYTTTINHYLQPIFPISGIHEPNYDYKGWSANGEFIPAISITMDVTTNVEKNTTESNIYPYPNPATNLLTIPLRKKVNGNVQLEVFDVLGKIVLTEHKIINNEPLKINVASIKNGNYLINLTFVDGTTERFKISINR